MRDTDAGYTQSLLQSGSEIDRKAGRKIVGKVDVNVLPFVFAAVFVVSIDRANLVLQGSDICKSLKITDEALRGGNLLFLAGLLLFQVPSNMMMERFHAGRYIGALVGVWGVAAGLSVFVTDEIGFYIVRFLLGSIEAGIVPGLWYYCTLFYPENSLVLPFAVVEVGRFSSAMLSVPLSSYIRKLGGSLAGWQWALVLEGSCALVIGLILLFIMPGSLSDCYFLNVKEAKYLQSRIQGHNTQRRTRVVKGTERLVQEWRGVLLCGGLWVCSGVKHYSSMVDHLLYLWLPAIVSDRKEKNVLIGHVHTVACTPPTNDQQGFGSGFTSVWFYAAIPYAVAFFGAFLVAVTARKANDQKHHVAWSLLISVVSLIVAPLVALSGSWPAVLVFLSAAIVGVLVSGGPLVAMASSFLSVNQKAAGFAALGMIEQCAGYLGVVVTNSLLTDHGSFTVPMVALGIVLAFGALIILTLPDPIKMARKPILSTEVYMGEFQGIVNKGEPSEDAQPQRPIIPTVPSMAMDAPLPDPEVTYATIAYAFNGEQDGELTVAAGDVVEVMSTEKDGWVSVRRGYEEGLVPVGYLMDDSGDV